MVKHYPISLRPYARGFHIITREVLESVELPSDGIFHLFIQHTSAGLAINENADPSVLVDFESFYNDIVPEHQSYVTHDAEGPDDMPAHIKSSMVGSSISIPIVDGRLALGTWQGIYLCEFRNHASGRRLIATIYS